MSRFVTIVLGFSFASLLMLSLAPNIFGFRIEHKKNQAEAPVSNHNLENNEPKEHPGFQPMMDPRVNEINYCIMGCMKCANGDIYFKDESFSESPITVVCANSCLATPDLKELIFELSKRRHTKSYAKCLIDHSLNRDYY